MDGQGTYPVLIATGPDKQGICRITFNRPEKANALNAELAHAWLESVRLAGKSGCQGLIVTGLAETSALDSTSLDSRRYLQVTLSIVSLQLSSLCKSFEQHRLSASASLRVRLLVRGLISLLRVHIG